MSRASRRSDGSGSRSAAVAALLQKSRSTLECEVRGDSMANVLPAGSRIKVQFTAVDVAVGDVVAFTAAGGVIVHRVAAQGRFGRGRTFILTRGDNSLLLDHPVPRAAVLGVVRAWRNRGVWEPVGVPERPWWARVLGHACCWPVLIALHLHPALAKALTVGSLTCRTLVYGARKPATGAFG